MARLAALLVGSSLAVSLACGGGSTPRAGPTIDGTPSASGAPPALVVSDSDSSMAAALGTYC